MKEPERKRALLEVRHTAQEEGPQSRSKRRESHWKGLFNCREKVPKSHGLKTKSS